MCLCLGEIRSDTVSTAGGRQLFFNVSTSQATSGVQYLMRLVPSANVNTLFSICQELGGLISGVTSRFSGACSPLQQVRGLAVVDRSLRHFPYLRRCYSIFASHSELHWRGFRLWGCPAAVMAISHLHCPIHSETRATSPTVMCRDLNHQIIY